MKNIVILYSGGFDSYLMYKLAQQLAGQDVNVTNVYYDIGVNYSQAEIDHIKRGNIPCDIKRVDWYDGEDTFCNNALNSRKHVNQVVPGRNFVFSTLAAMQYLPDEIWLGTMSGEDNLAARDKNGIFAGAASMINNYILGGLISPGTDIPLVVPHLRIPFAEQNITKTQALQMAVKFGLTPEIVASETLSCYNPIETANGVEHCGKCLSCTDRIRAFKEAGYVAE